MNHTVTSTTTMVTGYYGSGKTEFVVNLALALSQAAPVTIADLDVVNPFFRSREREVDLAPYGIEIMGSAIKNHVAQDLPAVSYGFLSRIRSGQQVILDLAGGEGGLRLLANCYDAIAHLGSYRFFCVLNMYRPETDTPGKMLDFCREVNRFSQLPITGLVNNGHMLSHTQPEHILASQQAVETVAAALGVPFAYTLVQEDIYHGIKDHITSEQVLTFAKPHMRKDWQG